MLRNAFEDGFSLDISPVHTISAMFLHGLGGVLPKGERRSRTLFEIYKGSDTLLHDGQVCSTQTAQGIRAQRYVRKIAHNFDRIDQRLFFLGSQCFQVTIVEIDQRFQTFARLEIRPV